MYANTNPAFPGMDSNTRASSSAFPSTNPEDLPYMWCPLPCLPCDGPLMFTTRTTPDHVKARMDLLMLHAEGHPYCLPTISGAFNPGLIIRNQNRQRSLCVQANPVYRTVISSTIEERAAMFAIGSNLAHMVIGNGQSLFSCTILAKQHLSYALKNAVSCSLNDWTEHMSEIYTYLGAETTEGLPSSADLRAKYPIDQITQLAREQIGEKINTNSLYVCMDRTKSPQDSRDYLSFPREIQRAPMTKEELVDKEIVPVVYVEPLRIHVPEYPRHDLPGAFESQLYVIAGDVLVVPFRSDIMTLSCAMNIALERAARHGVIHVRSFIMIDLWSMMILNVIVPYL